MSEFAIETDNLGKHFRLGALGGSKAVHELFERTMRRMLPGLGPGPGEKGAEGIWALRNVDLQVRHGEIVGLVGHNGAGKSVLLKLLSRITWPTEGHALVAGRVGSMLEVGAGFHPEFTGRENLFLFGATLGMSLSEVRAKFDEIVAFAGIDEFLDTPVKRYSSGLYVRLAFSVAAYLDANLMLFDEVISVGDVDFRARCHQRIREMAAEGRTILFVSHNLEAVRSLCPRTLMLEHGMLVQDGPTSSVLQHYTHGPAES